MGVYGNMDHGRVCSRKRGVRRGHCLIFASCDKRMGHVEMKCACLRAREVWKFHAEFDFLPTCCVFMLVFISDPGRRNVNWNMLCAVRRQICFTRDM